MYEHRFEVMGWIGALVVVAVMGAIVAFGPFHKINKPAAVSSYPTLHVKIVTDQKTAGRYVPAVIKVHVGQPIIFTNVSDVTHTVTGRADGSFNSGDVKVGQSFRLQLQKTGAYQYYCVYHPFMAGTIVVQPSVQHP